MTLIKKQARLVDIAKAAGVAKSTASMALSRHWSINRDTQERIRRIADELGYEANPHALRLGGKKGKTIALLANGIDRSVGREKLLAIQHGLSEVGYDVPIYACGDGSDQFSATQGKLLTELRRLHPLAIVFHNAQLSPASLQELRRYQEQGGLVLSYGEETDLECDQVIIDANENMYRAARYLLEQGHRKLGLCEHTEFMGPRSGRLAGFQRALAEFDVPYRSDWRFWGGLFEENGAMLAERYLALTEKPTGLCIVNDYSASSFVNCMTRAGCRIPDDVSIVAHDDGMAAIYSLVPLTTVSHPIEATARAVQELLCPRIDETFSGPPRKVVVYGTLVVRDSVKEAPAVVHSV